jgi:hypothetical protein
MQELVGSLGVPSSFNLPSRKAVEGEPDVSPRELNEEERKGLWVLLGFIGSVWLFGGYIHRRRDEKPH